MSALCGEDGVPPVASPFFLEDWNLKRQAWIEKPERLQELYPADRNAYRLYDAHVDITMFALYRLWSRFIVHASAIR